MNVLFPPQTPNSARATIGVRSSFRAIGLGMLLWSVGISSGLAGYKDDIGFTALQAQLGGSIPNGAGITVLQVEALEGSNYSPNLSNPQFAGKTLTLYSGASSTSSHANTVAEYFYGNSTSIAPGITSVGLAEANDYINALYNGGGTNAPGNLSGFKVQNSSWVGDAGGATNAVILHRLDYEIARDNVISVVGVNNGPTDQPLLATAYNVISVGVTSGNNPTAPTGVQRPDIVAPAGFTSFATPMVSAAAALLLDAGTTANSQNNVVIKSLLMAGATKTEFVSWTRTDIRPLDNNHGAGELNIYNSYHILTAGEQTASVVSTVANTGWDFSTISTGTDAYYYFDITDTSNVSVSLNWNALYSPIAGDYDNMSLSLANLDLSIYNVVGLGFTLSSLVQQSISTNQSLEYLWVTGLAAGRYALKVNSVLGNSDYAVSWQANVVPEPSTLGLVVLGGILVIVRRRNLRR